MSLELATRPKNQTAAAEEAKAHDLIIIGGGPAGLAAAIYALRFQINTLLIEKMVLGGLASTAYQIENYPGFPDGISGLDLCQKMTEQAQKLGLKVMWGNVVKIKNNKSHREVLIDGKALSAKAVIIATGSEPTKLGIPGEEEFRGKGVSYCATCDGPFYRDKDVMVVGGGNSAVEEALFLTRYARKVSIVHRRDELRADKILVEKARNHPKIYFFLHSIPEKIIGEKMVSEVVLKDLLAEKTIRVPVQGIFVYIGSNPNTKFLKGIIKLDEKGFILTDEKMTTSVPGIFAAGDARAKSLRQVVTAVSDGATAANSAREYLTSLTGSV